MGNMRNLHHHPELHRPVPPAVTGCSETGVCVAYWTPGIIELPGIYNQKQNKLNISPYLFVSAEY